MLRINVESNPKSENEGFIVFHLVSSCGIKPFVVNGFRQKLDILLLDDTQWNVEHHYTTIYTTLFWPPLRIQLVFMLH